MAAPRRHFITDGEFLVTNSPSEIHTVLGSCVSVCFWDKMLKMAGMNHYLLPGSATGEAGNPNLGISSIRMLICSMTNRGSLLKNMNAKIFGGANSLSPGNSSVCVGSRNVEVAFSLLKEYGIHVNGFHTGGCCGRKIIFDTASGKVKMYLLNKTPEEVNEQIYKGFNY